jgi:hypothetical protein
MAKPKHNDNGLQIIQPQFPMLPELFQNAMPATVPQMNYGSGVVADWKHNWKLGRMEKATQREASIARSKKEMVIDNLAAMKALMTFSADVQLQFKEFEHRQNMMTLEAIGKQQLINAVTLDNQLRQEKVIEAQRKNQLLENEVKLSALEFQIKEREFDGILNGPSAN